jgi:hypothetical protein
VATLPEPGWWCMTATLKSQKAARPNQRATLWVHVDEKK